MPKHVSVKNSGGFTCFSSARDHSLTVDEPIENGGKDEGATPWEYVMTGMGACTAITLQSYAKRKGWPLESVNVSMERDGAPADHVPITITVEITGDLSNEQVQRLSVIASKCPVVKSLSGGVPIQETVSHVATAAG